MIKSCLPEKIFYCKPIFTNAFLIYLLYSSIRWRKLSMHQRRKSCLTPSQLLSRLQNNRLPVVDMSRALFCFHGIEIGSYFSRQSQGLCHNRGLAKKSVAGVRSCRTSNDGVLSIGSFFLKMFRFQPCSNCVSFNKHRSTFVKLKGLLTGCWRCS